MGAGGGGFTARSNTKKSPLSRALDKWRRGRDSNPRRGVNPLTVFETAAFDHSATSPELSNCNPIFDRAALCGPREGGIDCAPSVLALRYRCGLFRPLRGLHIELAYARFEPSKGRKPLNGFRDRRIDCAPCRRLPCASLRVASHRARLRLGSTTLPPLQNWSSCVLYPMSTVCARLRSVGSQSGALELPATGSRARMLPERPAKDRWAENPVQAANLPSAPISCMIPKGKAVEADRHMAVRGERKSGSGHRNGLKLPPEILVVPIYINEMRASDSRFSVIYDVSGPAFIIGRIRRLFSSCASQESPCLI